MKTSNKRNLGALKTDPSGLSLGETFKGIWFFLAEDRGRFVRGWFILVVMYLYDLVPAFVLGLSIDFFTEWNKGESLAPFYYYAIFLGLSWSLMSVVRLHYKNKLAKIAIRAKSRSRVLCFDRLLNFSLAWHANENTGNKVQRIVSGGESVRELVRTIYNEGLRVFTRIGSVVIIISFLDLTLALVLAIFSAIFLSLELYFNRQIIALNDSYNLANEGSAGMLNEGTGNMLSIKALGAETNIQKRVVVGEEVARDVQLKRADIKARKWMSFQILTGLFMGGYLLLLGRGFVLDIFTIGSIAIFFTYFEEVRGACIMMTDITSEVVESRSAFSRMMTLFKDVPKVRSGTKTFPKRSDIKLTNAHFSYASGQNGIREINLKVGHQEILGIAGLSGSGKSTLTKVLMGLYEISEGKFEIGGEDYYDIKRENVSANMSVVLQETELFNFSLRDNITLMRDVSSKVLERAIQISQLESVVERLPEGLDAQIGERGYMLSGGERQRLGIARAICKDPKIIVLDEATSSLDSKTEKKITDGLLNEFGGKKTFIVIAHRLSTLKNADRVVVFHGGTIVEEGTFAELSRKEGSHFAEMYKIQTEKKKHVVS